MMRRFLTLFTLLAMLPGLRGQNLLQNAVSGEELASILIPGDSYAPVPGLNDREAWENLSPELRNAYISRAEELLDYEWPSISATTTLLFVTTGDRDEYQGLSFPKRRNLGTLVLAEAMENKGRFMEQILNGIWSICEESDWGVPAHYKLSPAGSGLPDVTNPWVDLFAAETVNFLAWTDYFLGEKLDSISPLIRKRIRFEADRRVFHPILKIPHEWMDWTFNWNPWICSNWLSAALLLLDDEEARVKHTTMAIEALDNFLNPYPADGGCDEGPGYWGAAGASLFESLEILNLATGGCYQLFDDPKIRNIGSYIYKVQISRDNFINFADADNRMNPDGEWVYRFGKRIDDPLMMQFGAAYAEPGTVREAFQFSRTVLTLFENYSGEAIEPGLPLPEKVWFPAIQVMVSRDNAGSDEGFFLAVKGGHNGEAHNHNDVGNYIVYYDGRPLLIDAGRGTYTARFFGDDRWSIWMTNSRHHNVPEVNGTEQAVGTEFRATEANFLEKGKTRSLQMELKEAYPEDAGIESLMRTVSHKKASGITVVDRVSMEKPGDLAEIMMTLYKPDLSEKGIIKLKMPDETGNIQTFGISYNPDILEASYKRMPLDLEEDKAIIRKWGEEIYRISLKSRKALKQGKLEMRIREL